MTTINNNNISSPSNYSTSIEERATVDPKELPVSTTISKLLNNLSPEEAKAFEKCQYILAQASKSIPTPPPLTSKETLTSYILTIEAKISTLTEGLKKLEGELSTMSPTLGGGKSIMNPRYERIVSQIDNINDQLKKGEKLLNLLKQELNRL